MKCNRMLLPMLFLAMFSVAARAQEIGKPAPRMEIKDIFNKTVPPAQLKDWVVLIALGNMDNKDTILEWLKQVRIAVPERDNILFVVAADTRKFRLLKVFAKGVVKQGYEEQMAEFDKIIKEKNLQIKGIPRDYFLLVTDWSATFFKAFGVEAAADKPHLFIIDGAGILRAHYTVGDTTESMVTMTQSLFSELDARKAEAGKITFGKARSSWLRRLIIPGMVLTYFALK